MSKVYRFVCKCGYVINHIGVSVNNYKVVCGRCGKVMKRKPTKINQDLSGGL